MRIRQNAIVIFSKIEEQTCSGGKKVQWAGFLSFRERELLLSRFSVVRTVDSRRSKK